ncbi:protein SPA1-RELATED 2 [Daucus carota subsp. sativus]
MFNLRNRILPPDFLAENPEEARLCFWLLHPEPSFRPSIREIVESDVIKDIEDLSNSSSSFNHDDIDQSELLLHFLNSLQQHKHDRSSKLIKEITLLENDIEEVNKRRRRMSFSPEDLVHAREEVPRESSSGVNCNKSPQVSHEEMLVKNLDQLEKTYFSMRSNVGSSSTEPIRCDFKEMCSQETSYQAKNDGEMKKSTDDLGAFYNGLGKYARYTKFKVCATLSTENLYNLNIISSLSFDPNEDYFAVAGVSKKIKIHNFHAVLDNTGDGQYPVMQMSNNSKLSCTCWNNNISNCLASSDYDGAVKLWDTETGKEVSRYTEHSKRAWSVDFSQVSPTKLASGGDDCSVKLWDTNQKSSAMSIRIISPVCCVQFHSKSSNLLAFGASNSHTYCMDLRNTKKPWCMLVGHANPVSYIKFLDSETAISASTDSTLKIWDLNKRGSCISTLAGHTNKKIFVGLSVTDDGYIMCGSETNEVFAYHRSFSMPITSHKFGDDEDGHFVSAVCSRKQSELMVAANSTGSIKVLQMV